MKRPLTFATMSAGWTGGTQNFVAVQEALSVTDAAMTYTLLMGALCYSVWLVVIIAAKPLKERFDGFLRADDQGLEDVLHELDDLGSAETVDMRSLMLMIGLSLVIASLSHHLGATLAAFRMAQSDDLDHYHLVFARHGGGAHSTRPDRG